MEGIGGMKNYWFLLDGDRLLLDDARILPRFETLPDFVRLGGTVLTLPELDGVPCFAAALAGFATHGGYSLVGLRASFDVLPEAHYAMAGKARELLYWDAQTAYCSVCGAPMCMNTDISKVCTACNREIWPAISPAVIVAVTRGREILLVQSKNFRGDYLGLVAGFVETGETLEESVAREVMEETHIQIKNLRYFASQPWPYPSNLMVGFTAEYAGGELNLQRSELNKGGWYDLDDLPAIPGKVSLARRLIDAVKSARSGKPDSNE